MRKTIGALALVMLAAVPARAQNEHAAGHGQMQHGQMAEMMMAHHAAHAALMHRQELGLSADQVARLTAVDSAQMRAMRQHCEQVRAAGGPSAQTHAAMHPQMMAQMQGFQRDAQAVLTQAQKARLDSLHAAHHGAGAGAGHDMSAMHQMHGNAAQHDSMHAAHGAAGGSTETCMDGCTDEACCHMMGCDEHSKHAEHAGHTTG
ncbi:MAG TPA: hypothetical protein VFJ16_29280 [Longimicrobium sp.]|nr:hypothetical protein [Longimicrobium sp.]